MSKGVTVKVQVSTDHTAILTGDGQFEVDLLDNDEIIMRASPWVGRFVRLQGETYFYRTLMHRLGWPQTEKRL